MADRSIGADDLGAFGEAHFEKLCHSAGLVANKSYQDKMGWDYVVERTPHDEGPSLDTRQLFPLCRVQVKTVWKRDDGRVNLGLSAAERLAKPEALHLWSPSKWRKTTMVPALCRPTSYT